MKKLLVIAVLVIVTFVLSVSAFAVPAGKTVEFDGKGAGKVVFDGKMHADKGLKCADCHPGVFKMKKGADVITMADINAGKAFAPKECAKCHKK